MRSVTAIERGHPLTSKDAGPTPIASPTSAKDLTPIVDPDGNPKKFDPSTLHQSPTHEQVQKQNEACLSTGLKPIFVELARATSSGFREENLAETLCFGGSVNESTMENALSH